MLFVESDAWREQLPAGLVENSGYCGTGEHYPPCEIQTRVFPDDGAGFEDTTVLLDDDDRIIWPDFRHYDRLERWSVAHDDQATTALPEARIIFRWHQRGRGGYDDDGNPVLDHTLVSATPAWISRDYRDLFDDNRDRSGSWYVTAAPIVHFEIPLWRTGNVINKLRRCSRDISR